MKEKYIITQYGNNRKAIQVGPFWLLKIVWIFINLL